MFTKFRSGGGGQYDLASFSGDASLRAIKSGSVAPLDTSKLTNFKDLAPQLQSPDFNTVRTASTTACRSCGARTS